VPVVLNEWIFHDIRGENGLVAQSQSAELLQAFQRGPDAIVVLRESRWMDKAYALMTVSATPVRILSQFLRLAILLDPAKCHFVEQDAIQPLPPELAQQVPDDDAYLFQTALAGGADVIVTADTRLVERVTNAHERGIRLRLREEFIAEFLAG